MVKQVPLVIYIKGVRHELGKAIVNDDGSIESQIESDKWPIVKDYLQPGMGELSIAPTPKKDIYVFPYNKMPPPPPKV